MRVDISHEISAPHGYLTSDARKRAEAHRCVCGEHSGVYWAVNEQTGETASVMHCRDCEKPISGPVYLHGIAVSSH